MLREKSLLKKQTKKPKLLFKQRSTNSYMPLLGLAAVNAANPVSPKIPLVFFLEKSKASSRHCVMSPTSVYCARVTPDGNDPKSQPFSVQAGAAVGLALLLHL